MTRSMVEDVWPLSPLQEGLLFHATFDDEGPDVYTVQSAFAVHGPLDADRLRASWEVLLARHAALRACFRRVSGARTVQVVARDVTLPWREADVSALDAEAASARAGLLAEEERTRRFDLSEAPLLRLMLIRLGPDRHRMVFTGHHILMDGWSVPVLLSELAQVYAAGADGSALPRTASYRDYLDWLARQDKEAAREAWRKELAGLDEPTLVVPAVPDREPAIPGDVLLEVPEEATRRLTELARRNRLTVNTVVQGAWALVLARLAGRTDVVFGATVSGRPAELPDVERMVGLLINTLPVRVRLDGTQPVLEMLKDLQRRQTALLPHQHLGLPEVQALGGPGSLFDTLMVYENAPHAPAQPPGPGALHLQPDGLSRNGAHYPFTLGVFPGARMSMRLSFRPDLISRQEARRIGERVVRVLEQVTADPAAPVGRITVLDAGERRAAVREAHGAAAHAPRPPVAEQVAAQAARNPGAVAVTDDRGELTYERLWERSGRLAAYLEESGIGRGDRVAVVLERSAELLMTLLAVWRAGAAYVPLDAGYPPERMALMLADCAPAAVVCTSATGTVLPADAAARTVALDDPRVSEAVAASPADRRPAPVGADDLAYVMYTSGSTGTPKGVAVPHGGVAALVGERGWSLGAHDAVLMHAPHAFDASLFEVWAPLAAGARVVVAPPGVVGTEEIRAAVARGVTALHLTAGAFRVVAEQAPECFSGLREVLTGGDVVPPAAVARVRQACPDTAVRHLYGPTETTLCATWHLLPPGAEAGPELPLGRPLDDRGAHVLDAFLQPVPPGTAGELYLSGTGLAHGYLGRTGPTAERFVACPYAPGRRMYRTGDLVRRTSEGRLLFAGRADDQVKIRGFRVEPGEVEAALAAHPSVAQAVVTARADRFGERRLVGYVVPDGPEIDPEGVRGHAATVLPAPMVPVAVLVMAELPLTPNGKVDRAALPDADLTERVSATAPANETEQTLCALFAEVLGLERVGADDDFFRLGGTSGLAMRLLGRIREEFDAELTLRQLFGASSPVGMARTLAAKARPALVPAVYGDEAPATAAQLRTWLMTRLDDDGAGHQVSVALRLHGRLDREALGSALEDVAERHQILRTTFSGVRGDLRQHIRDVAAVRPGPVVRTATEARLPELLAAGTAHDFDLTREAPWAQYLFALSGTEHVLLLVVHRIAADEASLNLLVRDLAAAYGARRKGRAPDRAPLHHQFAEYALWERTLLQGTPEAGSFVGDQLAYWKEALAGVDRPLELPADRPRPALPSRHGARVPLRVDADLHGSLASLAERYEATVPLVVHAALTALLSRLGAGTDVPVGSWLPRRTEEGLDGLVGPFAGPLVLRTDTSGDPGFPELLGRVQRTDKQARRHQDVPFERMMDELALTPSAAYHPVFQVGLDIVDDPLEAWEEWSLPGLRTTRLDTGRVTTDLDLFLGLTGRRRADGSPGGFEGHLCYATDLFDETTATALGDRLLRVLGQVTADPELRLSRIDVLLGPDEARRLVGRGSAAAAQDPPGTVVGRVAARAARTPGAVAVTGRDGTLTYARLTAAAGRLTRRLTRHGVGPGDVVVVARFPAAGLLAALLGVLGTGAACHIKDADRPRPEIRALVRRTRPAALLRPAGTARLLPADSTVAELVLDDPAAGEDLAGHAAPNHTAGRTPLPAHPALVLDTTAPSGAPTGVVVDHRALVGQVSHYRHTIPALGGTTLPDTRAPFAALVAPLLAALCAGGTIRLTAPDEGGPAAGDGGTPLAVTTGELLPTFTALADARFAGTLLVPDGGPSAGADVRTWREQHPHATLLSGYGAAGTAGPWLESRTGPGAAVPRELPSGTPVPGTRAFVLDSLLRPVPPGVTGDVYVAGAALAQSCHAAPGPTGERFVACPFGAPGERMLRTGDRAKRTAAGEFTVRDGRQEAPEGKTPAARDHDDLGVLLPLRAAGSRPPLFCVHPTSGLSWGYLGLLRHVPQDRPVYGVQARGLAGTEPMPRSIGEMAADYVDQIRTVQPAGPYHLLGWSFGGTVAQAMAARLADAGEDVALLAVLDAYPSDAVAISTGPTSGDDLPNLNNDPGEARVQWELDALIEEGFLTGGGAVTDEQLRATVGDLVVRLARYTADHTPPRYRGDLLLFIAAEEERAERPGPDAAASWQPYVQGSVEAYEVPARHHELLQGAPLAYIGRVLAEKLREDAGTPGTPPKENAKKKGTGR
ncbi:amino acid adenylation domain-containing protein [Streptomyces sp. NPDC017529]|uniref:amino acid adenylation domain-containing protein n=1 Tax=Streptomyces sp. NPDC017529 TaxID=3365000 RepID=UPI00378DF29F